jgi:hypothetical protein
MEKMGGVERSRQPRFPRSPFLRRELGVPSSPPTIDSELWGIAVEFQKLRGDHSFLILRPKSAL